ncbi:serine hydrolase domain-containing protein [Sphingomicrobium arenosum]|uniref:serine hydrolase domain-containing protein n=1 Tax=Sphingomicrobium arenosum TaxID=2233861 RepID=UPI002240877D|nr:serine hydrolase domain-containing protein [Sphingomicrobium arenosum]
MKRRDALKLIGGGSLIGLGGCATSAVGVRDGAVRDYGPLFAELERLVREVPIPSLNAAIVRDGRTVFAAAIGYADVETRREIKRDTIQNFGSTTKMVTLTAAMQLVERGRLSLDADVDELLPFSVANPAFPDTPITLRQLLSHRSSVRDDERYEDSYACGQVAVGLGDWLAGYFEAGGAYADWAPGSADKREYSNVGTALVGHMVERASGLEFEEYCRANIFEPLGMERSRFSLDGAAADAMAVPYTVTPEWFGERHFAGRFAKLSRYDLEQRPIEVGAARPFCQYSLPTFPDGGLRSNAREFARFIGAWANGGWSAETGARLLGPESMGFILGEPLVGWERRERFYGDSERSLPGGALVCHNGADPGVGSFAGFRPGTGDGIVFAFNRWFMDHVADAVLEAMLPYLVD